MAKNNKAIVHVILCGGSGSRLWPLSRERNPKQFLKLVGQNSFLQQTALGNHKFCSDLMLVCNIEHSYLAQNQMEACHLRPTRYILESIPKNTAGAVCLALFSLDLDSIVLITPADHYINYDEEYRIALEQAQHFANQNEISIFGICPFIPETGYGYIEVGSNYEVKRFHEKPSADVALQYLKSDNFYWNSGMICSKVGVLLRAISDHAPIIFNAAQIAYNKASIFGVDPAIFKVPFQEMQNIPNESIDIALLEKMQGLRCVQATFQWNDVGSFDSLLTHFPKDEEGNFANNQNLVSVNSTNNFVMGNKRMISMVDVRDLIVIDTLDALLISKQGSAQKVKMIVNQIQNTNPDLHRSHLEESRFWGNFSVLEAHENYKVKRIVVHPEKRLSLQKHQYRSEHWVVVSGIAKVTKGNEKIFLEANQSVYIPLGEIHRIENPGKEDLIIIEVQFGTYTGEDDIIRIEDDFAAHR